ncbi:hypothetical protein QQS21_012690, partial [Conoideocrella luteorostrata]
MLPHKVLLMVVAALAGHEVAALPLGLDGLVGAAVPGFGAGLTNAAQRGAGARQGAAARQGAGAKQGAAAAGGGAKKAAGGAAAGGATAGGGKKAAGGGAGGAAGGGRQPSAQAIDNAAASWQADTGIVSQFLSTAENLSGKQLQQAASKALDAENDELNHKAVLDKMFLNGRQNNRDATVAQADQVLDKQGTFQFVVDGLQTLTNRGARMSANQVSAMIQSINNDRCPQVLPNIDRYLAAAGNAGQSGNTLQA